METNTWDARDAVTRGASYLDNVYPDWYHEDNININTLAIQLTNRCVLGQLFDAGSWESGFSRGIHELGLGVNDTEALGFTLPEMAGHFNWPLLTVAWINAIINRRTLEASK